MSETPETQSPAPAEQAPEKPRPAAKQQPSFDEILAAAGEPQKPAPKPAPREPQKQQPKAQAQPSFDEILAGASSTPPPAEAEEAQERGRNRGPQKGRQREERKMPVVVRKIQLPGKAEKAAEAEAEAQAGAAAEARAGAAAGAQAGAEPQAAAETPAGAALAADAQQPQQQRRQQRQRAAPAPMPESAFAAEFADEHADFGAMLAESGAQKQGRLKPGAKVSARVAHLGAEVAFLDLGGKGEGIIDLRELRGDKGDLLVQIGETLEGYVLSVGEGNVVVTKSVPKGAGREALAHALESRIPVEGLVTAVNKGGLEIDLGGARAFCPSSQVDVRFVEDMSGFVGQRLQFRVTEIRGGNAILSRRALLEEERKGKADELRKKLEVGASLEGTVISVRDFGAFVDLGGLEGLIHVSELTHARVAHAQDVVKPGQKVTVQVVRIEAPGVGKDGKPHGEKIALSLKALEQDPWDVARPSLEEGKKLQGRVARLQPFGAFVELFPGVDGLVHVSALSDRHVQHPREVVKEGEVIWVQVESVDDQSRRVALRRITEEEAKAEGPVPARAHEPRQGRGEGRGEGRPAGGEARPQAPRARIGDVVDATVEKCEAFGVFVTWQSGAFKGLVPNSELGTPRGSDNKKTTPPGTQFKAQIVDIDDRGRYRLSRTSAEAALDRAEYQEYQRKQQKGAGGKGFGTLGDLLRAKLQKE
jgi:small subunit ribosomal protein S1